MTARALVVVAVTAIVWTPSSEEDLALYRVYREGPGEPRKRLTEVDAGRADRGDVTRNCSSSGGTAVQTDEVVTSAAETPLPETSPNTIAMRPLLEPM